MGKAKERAAREEAKKAEARDDFTRLVRHAKSLKLESTWEDIKPELESHSAYKDVSLHYSNVAPTFRSTTKSHLPDIF